MKPQPRKGQTSLDFLMTYGWAVLLVVVVVASLFALGVFNAGSFLGPRATGFSQIGVIAWNVNAAGILSLKLQNFAGMDINVINIEATYGTSHFPYDITNVSIPNSKISDTFTVGAISGLAPGQYYTMPLRITYVDLNGFNYTETGTISGTVGAGAVPPSIRINSPSSNSLLNNRTINVSVTVWGNNLTSTDISIINESGIVDSITIPQLGTYSVLLNVTDDGVYNITALAHYSDGGSASATASNITVNISAQLGLQCGDPLDIPDHVYTLTGDANSSGICFTIAADNVTLDCAGYVIRGDGSGNGIYLFGHSNVTVKNCIVSGFGAGINIRAASSSNNTVTNSTFNDNSAGINIWSGASNNTITGNTVNNNTNYGIRLASSSNNIIANNTASSNGDSGFYSSDSSGNNYISNTAHGNTWQGIWLDQSSTLNTIEGNAITSNYYGVRFDGSSSNTIVGNNISGSYGAVYSSGNLFYDNFFSGNYQTTLGLGANAWNTTLNCSLGATTNIVGGPCIGGNFWADPSGTGFSENCTTNGSSNSSGICTVPYVIDGSNVDELPLTTNFTGLRLAVDDSVWVAHASSGNVYRINKTTNDTIGSPIAVDSHPYTIAVDPYSVWVANANSNTVSRINKTDTGDVTRISNSSFNNPWGVAVDQDSAWVANNNGNTVSRINKTDTGDVTTIYGIGSGPVGIAVDLDSVWTANNNGNTVSRINKTNTGDVTAIPVCTMPAGIAVGNDSVWVACQDSLGTISIINRTDTNQVTNITVGSYHGGIAIDQDSVWVVNNWGDYGGTVSRINETTGSVIGSPIPAGSNGCCQSSGQTGPFGIAVDQDSVWVTNLGGVVYRIDKATDTSTTIAVGQNPYSLGDMTGYAYDRIFLQHTNLTPAPSCVEPPSGLVAWWPGEDNATDIIGGNDGTWYGNLAYSSGEVGQAFSFDGGSVINSTSDSLPTINADRTLDAWINVDTTAQSTFAGYGNFGSAHETYQIGVQPGDVFFSQWGGAVYGPALQPGVWYHVAVTNIGDDVILYLNGSEVASGTLTISTPSGTHFAIGGAPGGYLSGKVDEVHVFNRALNASEIQAIYDAGSAGVCRPTTPPPTGLSGCGNISYSGDYVLTGDVSNSGTCFTIEADNVTLDCAGHNITGPGSSSDGIYNNGYNYTAVKNCNITGFENGIYVSSGSDNTIANNTVSSNTIDIYLISSSNNNIIANNTVSSSDIGIYLDNGPNYNSIVNNTAGSNIWGIYLSNSSFDTIAGNNASSNTDTGITIDYHSNNNTLTNNTADSNTNDGIFLSIGLDNILTDNNASSNTDTGITIDYSAHNVIANNNVSSNGQGIYSTGSSNNTVANNTASSNGQDGISLYSSPYNSVINNTVHDNQGNGYGGGIFLESDSDHNIIADNDLSSNADIGILLVASSGNVIKNNTVDSTRAEYGNGDGILLYSGSDYNSITNNTANDNQDDGIHFISSSSNNITGNTINSNGASGSGLMCGIHFSGSSNNIIANNTINSNGWQGIHFASSSGDNIIIGNNISSNVWVGFHFESGSNNIVADNTVDSGYSNYFSFYVEAASSGNTIANNTFSESSSNNGIVLQSSSNRLYNNLFNNSANAITLSGSSNSWNTTLYCAPDNANIIGGNCTGGNYWADLTGTGWSEVSSNCNANSSGICTSPYTIGGSNVDYLPLTNLTPPPPIELSGCTNISYSGNYVLTGDVSNSGTCFTIEANDVTLDCAGRNITGDSGAVVGVQIQGYHSPDVFRAIVRNCVISGYYDAIRADAYSGNHTISNNTVYNNTIGILIYYSDYNTIENNSAHDNSWGFMALVDSHNSFSGNFVYNNSQYGIYLAQTSGTVLYNNSLNNSDNVYTDSSNSWNTTLNCTGPKNIVGGNCTGGNYWAQPDGNGWSQNQSICNSNSSGLCTWQYNISTNNIDYLPLVMPPPALQSCGTGPTSGMVSYWRFDDGSGTNASDRMGVNNGTLVNSPNWVTGKAGNALNFSDTKYVSITPTSSLSGMSAVTLEAWIYSTDGSQSDRGVIGWLNDNADSYHMIIYPTNTLYFRTKTTNALVNLQGAVSTSLVGNWHHVVMVYNGSEMREYRDGVQDLATVSQSGAISRGTGSALTIGRYSSGNYFNGLIDEVAIYNRSLTASEIQQHYLDGIFGQGYCG